MKIIKEKKRITVHYYRLVFNDGFTFPDAYSVWEVLEDLKDCDGYFVRCLINDRLIAEKFQDLEIAVKNNRGSYGKGKNFQRYYDEVSKLVGEST